MIRDLILLLAIIGMHVLALLWLADATRMPASLPTGQIVTRIEFTRMPLQAQPRPSVARKADKTSSTVPPANNSAVPDSETGKQSSEEVLRVIGMDGSVMIPQDALDDFLGGAENKSFEIGRDGQDALRQLTHRPVALDYQSTRFDEAWQGDIPPLIRVLEKAVEKTTATIKIPIPGRPGAYFQCKIMVLAAGGGCGFTANDDGYYVLPDDPNTLSPEEDQQCQAWWDLIVSAKTQGEWRRTRTLYEKECRKPLLQAQ